MLFLFSQICYAALWSLEGTFMHWEDIVLLVCLLVALALVWRMAGRQDRRIVKKAVKFALGGEDDP